MKKKQSKTEKSTETTEIEKIEVQKPKNSFFKKRKKKIIDYDDFVEEEEDVQLEEDLENNPNYPSSMFDSISDHEDVEENEEDFHIISEREEDEDKLIIYFFKESKFNIGQLKFYISDMNENELQHCIIVYCDQITSSAKKGIENLEFQIELFSLKELQYNITEHRLVSKHTLVPKEEEKEEKEEELVVEKVKNKKKPDKKVFYVEPKKFDEEIVKFYESGVMNNELAGMVSKISNKLSYAPNFINYSYREEMVGDGIIRMMKALISKKYNREKGTNPFSYFTRIAFNAFRNRIKKEKHMHETHEKYRRELMSMSEGYSNLLKNNNIRIMKERDRLLE